ncbi:MAG: EF-P beta-lysylation protein EpmB [Gammaproteobacteria bacterium]
MIPQIKVKAQSQRPWQNALKTALTDPRALLKALNLSSDAIPWTENNFGMKVPLSFVAKMKQGDPNDPLLRQVLPVKFESEQTDGFVPDPLAERLQNPLPGLIHKFKNRVLVIPATRCPIHCRYCFRRHFPYDENNINLSAFDNIADYIAKDNNIHEVILSGGDPLFAPDRYLQSVIEKMTASEHIKILRFHTRFPITVPERIDDSFLTLVKHIKVQVVMVLHCNHPNELCNDIKAAVTLLKAAGVTVLNQSVLLKGINDNAETLIALSHRLFEHGIMPYYINQLDPIENTAHFEVPKEKIKELYADLLSNLPGYLVPRFVQEQAFKPNKIPLSI